MLRDRAGLAQAHTGAKWPRPECASQGNSRAAGPTRWPLTPRRSLPRLSRWSQVLLPELSRDNQASGGLGRLRRAAWGSGARLRTGGGGWTRERPPLRPAPGSPSLAEHAVLFPGAVQSRGGAGEAGGIPEGIPPPPPPLAPHTHVSAGPARIPPSAQRSRVRTGSSAVRSARQRSAVPGGSPLLRPARRRPRAPDPGAACRQRRGQAAPPLRARVSGGRSGLLGLQQEGSEAGWAGLPWGRA